MAKVLWKAKSDSERQKYDSAGTKNSKTKTVSKNVAKESAAAVTDDVTDVGEAVLTNAQVSNYVAKAKLEREQVHSKAKDTLEEIIKDQTVKDSVKQDAVDKLAMLSEQMEMETAAENLLGAKGFLNSIVTITNGKVDVLVNKKDLSKVERSQIEDIVVRKVGCQLGDSFSSIFVYFLDRNICFQFPIIINIVQNPFLTI